MGLLIWIQHKDAIALFISCALSLCWELLLLLEKIIVIIVFVILEHLLFMGPASFALWNGCLNLCRGALWFLVLLALAVAVVILVSLGGMLNADAGFISGRYSCESLLGGLRRILSYIAFYSLLIMHPTRLCMSSVNQGGVALSAMTLIHDPYSIGLRRDNTIDLVILTCRLRNLIWIIISIFNHIAGWSLNMSYNFEKLPTPVKPFKI